MKKRMLICMGAVMLTAILAGCRDQGGGAPSNGTTGGSRDNNTVSEGTDRPTAPPTEASGEQNAGISGGQNVGISGEQNAGISGEQNTGISGEQNMGISEEQAKEIALEDAGLTAEDVTAIRVKWEIDDGYEQYDVEFYAGGKEYDYTIDAVNGAIRGKDIDIEDDFLPADSGEIISEEAAVEIALQKVPGATVENVRIKLDYEDGQQVYEGKIIYDLTEYEFEISASDGRILSWEEESVFD